MYFNRCPFDHNFVNQRSIGQRAFNRLLIDRCLIDRNPNAFRLIDFCLNDHRIIDYCVVGHCLNDYILIHHVSKDFHPINHRLMNKPPVDHCPINHHFIVKMQMDLRFNAHRYNDHSAIAYPTINKNFMTFPTNDIRSFEHHPSVRCTFDCCQID